MKGKLIASCMLVLGLSQAAAADQNTVSMLNELLGGEISAVETYKQAMEKVGDVPGSDKLKTFHDNHVAAVGLLGKLVKDQGGVPVTSSGAWGTWAQTVMGSAKVLGDEAALKALKEGEEHGIKEYEEALENKNVPATIKKTISADILPKQRDHIHQIDQLMKNT